MAEVRAIKSTPGYIPTAEGVIASEFHRIIANATEFQRKVVHGWRPTPKQEEVRKVCVGSEYASETTSIVAFMGALGQGKTTTAVNVGTELAAAYPGIRILVGRATYQELNDTTRLAHTEELAKMGVTDYEINKRFSYLDMPNGSRFLYRSMDKIEKLSSLELGAFIFDEASELSEAFVIKVLERLRQQGIPRYIGIVVFNPTDKAHWLYKRFADTEQKKQNYHLVQAKLGDNPYLPPHAVDNLIREFINSPALYRRLVLGEWGVVQVGDPVFEGVFLRKIHVKQGLEFDRRYPLFRGWDTGWYHPCVVFNQLVAGQMRTLRVMMGAKIHLGAFIQRVKDFSAKEFPGAKFIDFADPHNLDAPSDLAEMSRLQTFFHYKIFPRYRHSHVQPGLDIMARKLSQLVGGEPGYVISDHPSCLLLIDAMESGYCWAKPEQETKKKLSREQQKEPYKDGYYDHCIDSTRYVFVGMLGPGAESKKVIPIPDTPAYNFGGSRIVVPRATLSLGQSDNLYLEEIRALRGAMRAR